MAERRVGKTIVCMGVEMKNKTMRMRVYAGDATQEPGAAER